MKWTGRGKVAGGLPQPVFGSRFEHAVSVSNADASARIGPGIAGSNVRVTVHFLHHSRDDKKRQSQYRDSDDAPEYVAHIFIVPTSPANSETNDADRNDAAGSLLATAGRSLRPARNTALFKALICARIRRG
jgi:hypothetical protein